MKQYVKLFFLSVILLCGSLLSTGCVSLRVPKASSAFESKSAVNRQAALAHIRRWKTRGAFSVQYKGRADIANFTWNQLGKARYQMTMSSALSLYRVQLFGGAKSVSIQRNNGETVTAKTPEALLQKTVGWYLPIRPLFYWYKGMVAPKTFGRYRAKYDAYGHLIALTQAGWQLQFLSYKRVGDVDLPQLILIKRPGLVVKIVTKQWRLGKSNG